MHKVLARKGIHYCTHQIDDDQIEYAFTEKMLANDVYIEFCEFSREVTVFVDNEDDDFEDQEVGDDEEAAGSDAHDEGTSQVYMETTVHVMALINKNGVHYTIMVQPHVPISKMVLYGIILNLVDILDNCPANEYHDYLQEVSTGNLSAMEIKQINPQITPTQDIKSTIKRLQHFLKEKRNPASHP
jgi:hypothetical protein